MEPSSRGAEVAAKLERVRGWLGREQRSGVLLRKRSNLSWLTAGGRTHVNGDRDTGAAAILVTSDRFVLVASNIEAARLADEEFGGLPVEVAEHPWYEPGGERRLLDSLVANSDALASDLDPGVAGAILDLRAELLDPEIVRFAELGRLSSTIVEDVCRQIRPGQLEDEVAAQVYAAAVALGARVPVALVAADGRIATRRHPLPGGRPIESRVMLAMCIEREGLTCSITRLVSFGSVDAELRRRHLAVCEVDAAAAAATRVGRTFGSVFDEIVAAYARTGFPDEWRFHHQGGSTGYQPRDTIATPGGAAVVKPSQAFAWNPSIAGTKSEDTMLTTAEGPRWITAPGPDWPTQSVEIGGQTFVRPDILAL